MDVQNYSTVQTGQYLQESIVVSLKVVIIHGEQIIVMEKDKQIHQQVLIIAIGFMEFLVMKHLVQDIGLVGMELLLSSSVQVDYYTMKDLDHVIGLKMSMVVKSTVSLF